MKRFFTSRFFYLLFGSGLLFLCGYFADHAGKHTSKNFSIAVSRAEKRLHQSEAEATAFLEAIMKQWQGDSLPLSPYTPPTHTTLLVYDHENLIYWSDNTTAFGYGEEELINFSENRVVKLRNGWYEVFNGRQHDKKFVLLLRIKNDFSYQNKYLVNSFADFLGLPGNATLLLSKESGSHPVYSQRHEYLFSLKHMEDKNPVTHWPGLLYLAGLVLLFTSFHFAGNGAGKKFVPHMLPFVCISVVWIFLKYFHYPASLLDLPLFSPQYYAESFLLSSPGDLFFFAFLLAYLTAGIRKFLVRTHIPRLFFYLFLFFSCCYGPVAGGILRGLVLNSSISFNVTNLFDLSWLSLPGAIITGMLLLSMYYCTEAFILAGIKVFERPALLRIHFSGIVVLFFLLAPVVFRYVHADVYLPSVLVIPVLGSLFLARKKPGIYTGLPHILAVVAVFSIYTSFVISRYNRLKEQETRKVLAGKVENERDHIAEYLFEQAEIKIMNDTTLSSLFAHQDNVQETVSQKLHQAYFGGYWNKYEITIYCYDSAKNVLAPPGSSLITHADFTEKMTYAEKSAHSNNFYFFRNESGRGDYLARVPVVRHYDGLYTGEIILLFRLKNIREEEGFPELLLSGNATLKNDLSDYSYAVYKNNLLVHHHGKYSYPLTVPASPLHRNRDYYFFEKNSYSHLYYKTGKNSMIVLSRARNGWQEFVTLFSYSFLFLSSGAWGYSFITQTFFRRKKNSVSLTNRIQLSVILITIISFVFTGGGTILYIKAKYEERQKDQVAEKISSVMSNIHDPLKNRDSLDNCVNEEVAYAFQNLASGLASDFNLYDLRGNILFTSQPRIIEQGIVSAKMNPAAYNTLSYGKETLVIKEERIGLLRFIAAYTPVINVRNKVIGYLGLPYFEKQVELRREISNFLVALINIYVLLLVLSVIAAVLVAGRITEPLRIIRGKLGSIRIGKRNELIEWKSKDEIGELVNEYNRMVNELAISAKRLAQSERESAWREMAQQVAHEIKNPLTPMKLSIQHLQRLWKDKAPHKEEALERLTQTLILQIETLASIASEFSNFAQMPKIKNEPVQLQTILTHAVNLFKDIPGTEILFEPRLTDTTGKATVIGDHEQLLRVFNNLIQNAIQAIPEGKAGRITVSLSEDAAHYTVAVADNGSGVPEEMIDKIFSPNFTTKTGGMGLGLAIVKNIVETLGGRIHFTTQKDMGSTFFVTLSKQSLQP